MTHTRILATAALVLGSALSIAARDEVGFTSLFDGKTLKGWQQVGQRAGGYIVEDGNIVCTAGGGGKLLTDREYDNFVLRFEFKLTPGANNGLGIRVPLDGDGAYAGMEIQILDNDHPKYAALQPGQYHGSIYQVVPAKRGALKPTGEWNEEEILADRRRIRVTLNGQVIVDANLDDVKDAEVVKKHPGLRRERGYIGFLGHGDRVEFRNIRIKELKGLPASPVIAGLAWAPPEAIVRQAAGSDNWPLTWADDDALYGAYGDGHGFEPGTADKLSLGLARITGAPPAHTGVNVRASTLETTGDDRRGKKASGMLMVDGVLYLLARNAGNAQLAWSTDRGKTWTWSDWKFTTSFGYPTFLNFGRNYAGARDDYVYVYSHDADSAYVAADRMVMARVPKRRIRLGDAYEFFKALDGRAQPIWTKNVAERGAVFTHEGKCYRSAVTYHASSRRYLWSQTLPGPVGAKENDARFNGGFGVYDAPEPWGPWTTVFFADRWDVGPGETSSFPTKWMSADGTALHLVFSGNDAFSVRKATLTMVR